VKLWFAHIPSGLPRAAFAATGGVVTTLAVGTAVIDLMLRVTPLPEPLQRSATASAEFVDRDNRPLRTLLVDQRRYQRDVLLADVSPFVIAATVSAEDKRFRSHCGVDPLALARAAYSAWRSGHATSGASTITQQLMKIASPGPRTLWRKLVETWCALALERRWSKDRILEAYLNRLDYGNLEIGIRSASQFYFGKPPSDLSGAEAAFVAALAKAPTRLEPNTHFDAARTRQRWVLGRMHRDDLLDPATLDRALDESIHLVSPRRDFAAPHFVDLLLQRKGILPSQGGSVHTTLDLPLNRYAEQCLNDQLARIADKHATSGAVVVIDNKRNEVLVLAGSGDYFQPGTGQINGAWSARSPGSAIKPFTYLLAFERGSNPCTIVPDVPADFITSTGIYSPNNYNHRFYGPVNLRFALGNSLNVGAIRTLELAGGSDALHARLREIGITTLDHSADYYGPGLTLGNAEVRLLELTNAFATIARLGVYRPYRLLRDTNDPIQPHRVFDSRAAYLVADILSDNSARAASFGLESFLSFDFPVACKTGTSSDYRDNWAIGFTPEYTVGVWVGNPDGSAMHGITGVTGAAPVLHDIVVHLHEQRGTSWFEVPEGVREYRVHPFTGRKVPVDRPGAITEKCASEPEPERTSDYDSMGRVLLPQEYAAWIASPQNCLGDLVACNTGSELRIISPAAGTVYFVDPNIPATTQRIPLRALAPGRVEWETDLLTSNEGATKRAQLEEGIHVLEARDSATGQVAATWIDVRGL
jgi:penicillin-binding protein 1C